MDALLTPQPTVAVPPSLSGCAFAVGFEGAAERDAAAVADGRCHGRRSASCYDSHQRSIEVQPSAPYHSTPPRSTV